MDAVTLKSALSLQVEAGEWDGVTRVYDPAGVERSFDWLVDWFGIRPEVVRAEPIDGVPYVMRCTELRTKDGEATQVVFTRGLNDEPFPGVGVVRWWSTAPGLVAFPDDCAASRWHDNGVIGITDGVLADVGFGMGGGDCPPGYSAVWPLHCEGPGDMVDKLGWGVGENHRVVWPVFRVIEAGTDPEPGPEPTDDVAEAVLAVAYEIAKLREDLGKGWVVIPCE